MIDNYLLSNIFIAVADITLLVASIYGILTFLVKKSPLYFRILTLATVCFSCTSIFRALHWLCYREDFKGMGITMLGVFGCYLFLFSANYGQYDSLIDDRTPRFRKYRVIALAAPIVMVTLILFYTVNNFENTTRFNNVVSGIGFLPAAAASYYNLKHFLVPDMGFTFVRWVRRANLCALIIEVSDITCVILYAKAGLVPGAIAEMVIAAAFLSMLMFAERGRRSWFQ